ncbi:MAG: hypothetical protein E7Z86_02775 [Methanosphaera stadtmanae]|nr:hypothetical protein [Methanosphaera stadtmanae]
MKTISKFLLLTLVLLFVGLATVSAADTNDTTAAVMSDHTTSNQITDKIAETNAQTSNMEENTQTDKIIKTNNKSIKNARTITVRSTTYNQFFTNSSGTIASTELIQSGDTVNLQGIFNNVNFAVDKNITLTSTNSNATLNNCTVYVTGKNASGSTVSNLKILNSKEQTTGIHIKNTTKITILNNYVKVNGKNSFAFAADKTNYSTIRNNYFQAALPTGQSYAHTTLVLGSSHYNNIINNTINCTANGIYLSSYGNTYANFEGGASNYNNITQNRVTGDDSGWCYTIQVMGESNRITYNNVSGGYRGISTQDYKNNVISNNDVQATSLGIYACEYANVTNNYVHVTQSATGITIGGEGVKIANNNITTVDGVAIEISGSKTNITNNTITSTNGYGIHSKGQYNNILIAENRITTGNEGILFKKQSSTKKINHVKVDKNTIKTTADYAINFEEAGASTASAINITVTSSNVLTSARGTGINNCYLKPSNANDQSITEDTNQTITITQSTYDEWFEDGIASIKIKQNATVYLKGTFNNLNFTFPKKVHIIGSNCVLNNATITLTTDAHSSTITNLKIKNNDKLVTRHGIEILDVNNCKITNVAIENQAEYESLGIFLDGASGNEISNCNITTTGDYINNGILAYSSDSNVFKNNNINIQQSSKAQPYDESIMFNERLGTIREVLHTHGIILLYSSDNTINANNIKGTSSFNNYTFPTNDCKNSMVGIDIYFDSHNNKVTNNKINLTSLGPFVYGMGVLGGYWGSSITSLNATTNQFKNNNVNVTGGYFATGFIAGRNSISTILDSNNITVNTIRNQTTKGDYAHGVTLENSTKSNITNNKINTQSTSAYPIELFDSTYNNIKNNVINANATQPYGIAGYRTSYNNMTGNNITTRKGNYGKTSTAVHSDVIPSGDDGILLMSESRYNNISYNNIDTNSTNTVRLTNQTSYNNVTQNALKSKSLIGDKSVLNQQSTNKVSNNFLYFVNVTVPNVTAELGTTVNITANIQSQATDLSNLTATFYLGTNNIGTAKVVNKKATLSYLVSTLWNPTTYTITTNVNGTNFQNVSAKSQATFTKPPEETVVTVAKVLQTVGKTAALKANITTKDGGKIGSGQAEFYIDNTKVATVNVNLGTASYNYQIASNAANTVHTIKVTYLGTADYKKSTGTNKLGVQTLTSITSQNQTSTIAKQVTLNAKITSASKALTTGKVKIYIANKQVATATITNGNINYNYTIPTSMDKGTYDLKFVYDGNDTVSSATKTVKLTVNAMTPVFSYNKTTVAVGKTANLLLKIDNGLTGTNYMTANNGNVTVKLNGKVLKDSKGNEIVGTMKNGSLTITFNATKDILGTHNISFVYAGNSKFNAATKTYTNSLSIVEKDNVIIKITTPTSAVTASDVPIALQVTDRSGSLVNSKLILKVNGLTQKDAKGNTLIINVTNGKTTYYLNLGGYSARNHTLTFKSVDNDHIPTENSTTLVVTKGTYAMDKITFNASSEQTITLNRTLKDVNGKVIRGVTKVAIKVGDRTVLTTSVTDGKLNVKFKIPYLPPGSNKFQITLGENYRYNMLRVKSTINIYKQNMTATITPVTAKRGQQITIKATVKNSGTKTNVISGKFSFKIDGATIKAESGSATAVSNGIAQIKYTIPSSMKTGLHNITFVYGSNTQTNSGRITQQVLTVKA